MSTVGDRSQRRPLPPPSWETLPAGGDPVPWSLDPGHGIIQGPLDLRFFGGRGLRLQLTGGQIGLLTSGGELRAVYLEGNHCLEVGSGEGAVSPEWGMFFLAADQLLSVAWDQRQSVWVPGSQDAPVQLPVSGGCSCRIVDPVLFHDAFLRFGTDVGDSFVLQVIDCLVRSRVEESLVRHCRRARPDLAGMQAHVDGLAPSDMDPGLERLGLACARLAIHLPVREERYVRLVAGQSSEMEFNSSH